MEKVVYKRMAQLQEHHWWFQARSYILTGLLDSLCIPQGASLLEVGSGTGANLSLLSKYGTVTALEPDETARKLCQERYHVLPDTGALPESIPYSSESFDLIAAFDVIEHISDDREVLSSLHRLLKPGGHLVLTVPAFPSLWSEHDVSHHHQRRYRRLPLEALLAEAGFIVNYASYYNCILFPLIALTRGVKKLFPGSGSPDDSLPHPLVNRLLFRLFAAERGRISRHRRFPFGVSLVAIASRRKG